MSKIFWLKQIQLELFPAEIKALKENKSIASNSFIIALNSFLDQDGYMRVEGRLKNAHILFKTKYPVS